MLGGKKPFHETSQVESHTGKFWATSNLCHSGLNNEGILRCEAFIDTDMRRIFGSISVSGQLPTYPSPNPTTVY